jgi:MFS family permease
MFTMAAGNLAMMSLFPAIARSSGIPDALMVTVQSLSAGLSIFTTPVWAARSDHVGRKQVILLGVAGFTVASLLTACAIFIATHRLAPVAVGVAALAGARAIFGGFGLAAMPAIQAHIADETSLAARTRVLASLFSANGLGSIVGPGLAPFLILPVIGLASPQAIFTVIGASILVAIFRLLPTKSAEPSHDRAADVSRWHILRHSGVWPFVAYTMVLSGCQATNLQILGFVVIDTTGLPPLAAQSFSGAAMMIGAAAAVSVQLGFLRWFQLRPATMMVCGIAIVIAGNLLMVAADRYLLVALSFVMTSVGYAFGMPAAVAGASLANRADQQGNVAGMISAAAGSGLLVAPVVALLIYHRSAAGPFIAIALILAALLFTIVPRCARTVTR